MKVGLNNEEGNIFLATKNFLHVPGLLDNVYYDISFYVATQNSSQLWRSSAMAFIPPQLPLPIPPQLQLVEQTWGLPEQQKNSPPEADGCSFYRSLARQLDGDPDHYWRIRDAVLYHYIRVFIDQGRQGGLYSRYIAFDNNFPAHRYGSFFFALSFPDPVIARPPQETDGDVLLVICNALNIRIVIWGDNHTLLGQGGAVACPEYHMKLVPDVGGREGVRFDSLLNDESGATLVDRLLRVKHDSYPLAIKEITWWRDPHPENWTDNRILNALGEKDTRTRIPDPPQQQREYKCYNEHLPVSILL